MYFTRKAQDEALAAFWDKKNKELDAPRVLVKIRDDAPITSIGGKFGPIYRGGEARWEPRPFAEYWKSQGWVDFIEENNQDMIELAKVIVSKKGTIWNGTPRSINERLTIPLEEAKSFEANRSARIVETFKDKQERVSV